MKSICCLDLTQADMFKLFECFLDVAVKHEMTTSHAARIVLRYVVKTSINFMWHLLFFQIKQ